MPSSAECGNCDPECDGRFSRHDDRALVACDWYGQIGTRVKVPLTGPPIEVPVYGTCGCRGWKKAA